MTMHPDNHAPHPARRFDDEDIYMPPMPGRHVHKRTGTRMDTSPPEPGRYRITARDVMTAAAEVVVFSFSLAALGFAALVFLADDRTRNAWGHWFRNLTGL
jgi:hypothetical protein